MHYSLSQEYIVSPELGIRIVIYNNSTMKSALFNALPTCRGVTALVVRTVLVHPRTNTSLSHCWYNYL